MLYSALSSLLTALAYSPSLVDTRQCARCAAKVSMHPIPTATPMASKALMEPDLAVAVTEVC